MNWKLNPLTVRKLQRFQSIKRGYWSFRVVTTLFVISLFLEMIVSSKALVIHYGARTAFPAN